MAPVSPQFHTSNPSTISQTLGGVGHNVSKAAHLLGSTVRLCTAIGDDLSGRAAIAQLAAQGLPTSGIRTLDSSTGHRTAQYIAINDTSRNLVLAMADMSIMESSADFTTTWEKHISETQPKWLVADANWDPATLRAWLHAGKAVNARTALEPVSVAKSTKLFTAASSTSSSKSQGPELPAFPHQLLDLAAPNALELAAMHMAARNAGLFDRDDWWSIIDALGIPSSGARKQLCLATSPRLVDQGIPQQSIQLLPFIPCILTKLGSQGVLLTMLLAGNDGRLRTAEAAPYILSRCKNGTSEVGGVYMRLFPPAELVTGTELVSVNGAGDTFLGALVAGLVRTGGGVENLIMGAQSAAVLSLKSKEAVSPGLAMLKGKLW